MLASRPFEPFRRVPLAAQPWLDRCRRRKFVMFLAILLAVGAVAGSGPAARAGEEGSGTNSPATSESAASELTTQHSATSESATRDTSDGDGAAGGPSSDSLPVEAQTLLASRCGKCHGPETQEGDFRTDRHASLLRGGASGEPAIVPSHSSESHLIRLVAGLDAQLVMPPDGEERLTAAEVDLLRRWIDAGALWSAKDSSENELSASDPSARVKHWSFQPLQRPSVPPVDSDWVQNPIDAFIWQKLAAESAHPSPPADRTDLIRRLYLDLVGLPPTPQEITEFVEQRTPLAYETLVDRLLSSPRYGERWARYWLDIVRFAETNGFETNRERPYAWPYRDYVIQSWNADRPYDQFIRDQLAGDVTGQSVATGYLVAGPYDLVKSPDISLTLMQRQNELDDMINTTGTAFLGLTLGCARCHNHKFDPIAQSDYYGLQAIFAGVQHGDRPLPLTTAQQERQQVVERQIVELRGRLQPFIKRVAAHRPAVQAGENEERFVPRLTRAVRFRILASSGGEPCLDELEIYSGSENVALATGGSKARASGTLPGYAIHQLAHIHDGQFGNDHSWISHESGSGWIEIEFAQPYTVDRIVWSRDRLGQFHDRLPTNYVIEAAVDGDQWLTLASSADRQPWTGGPAAPPEYDFDSCSPTSAMEGRRWLAELSEAERERESLQLTAGQVYGGKFEQPGPTRRLFRGDPLAPREEVAPNTVAELGDLGLEASAAEQQRRLALATWISSAQNPLTARVIVNRLWQFHFGRGLVGTPSDFGAAGALPTHPELLDWLAQELIDHQWSIKHLQRLILTSATYQQSSQPVAELARRDAAGSWLWRFPPRRLDAEAIRDSILAVSGVLDERQYGPGFSAFEVAMENVRHYFPKQSYGPADWRRMVYMTKVRMEQDATFGVFDCPDASTSVPQRSRSTTPLQSLNLFNSPFMLQQAELFAARLAREGGADVDQQIRRGFWLTVGREPVAAELSSARQIIAAHGLPAFCRALLNCNEFLFVP